MSRRANKPWPVHFPVEGYLAERRFSCCREVILLLLPVGRRFLLSSEAASICGFGIVFLTRRHSQRGAGIDVDRLTHRGSLVCLTKSLLVSDHCVPGGLGAIYHIFTVIGRASTLPLPNYANTHHATHP